MRDPILTPVVVALEHIQLAMPAGREAEAEEFYVEVLGFARIDKPAHLETRGGCWFQANGVNLHLGVEADFSPARKAHPAFVVVSLQEVKARLEAIGSEIIVDTQLDGYERFYTSDPFGNRLEFMERVE
jgi:catechol 2,3-dioxygenase-like lactoylglutathione lyase family enzyme